MKVVEVCTQPRPEQNYPRRLWSMATRTVKEVFEPPLGPGPDYYYHSILALPDWASPLKGINWGAAGVLTVADLGLRTATTLYELACGTLGETFKTAGLVGRGDNSVERDCNLWLAMPGRMPRARPALLPILGERIATRSRIAKPGSKPPSEISGTELDPMIGSGWLKNVHPYAGDPETWVVGVWRGEGIFFSPARLTRRELMELDNLRWAGIPAVEAYKVLVDGQPHMLYRRLAAGSKDIDFPSYLNWRSIGDLLLIRDRVLTHHLNIGDTQFLVSKQGRVVVADPTSVAIGPTEPTLKIIDEFIEKAWRNVSKERHHIPLGEAAALQVPALVQALEQREAAAAERADAETKDPAPTEVTAAGAKHE